MIRKTLIATALIVIAAGAVATAQAGKGDPIRPLTNVTVVQKTSEFPVLGPITVEPCAQEDCSDVQ